MVTLREIRLSREGRGNPEEGANKNARQAPRYRPIISAFEEAASSSPVEGNLAGPWEGLGN